MRRTSGRSLVDTAHADQTDAITALNLRPASGDPLVHRGAAPDVLLAAVLGRTEPEVGRIR